MKNIVGFSVAFCIKDIIEERINLNDIVYIISGTSVESSKDFERMVETYAECYWYKNPAQGIQIAERLWMDGKIIQPRLLNLNIAPIHNGHWAVIGPTKIIQKHAEESSYDLLFGG